MSVFVWSLQIKTSTVGSALLTYFNRIICYCSFFVHLCCLCCLGMWRENYNYASQIAPALINVKLISKSLTEGVVYRVAARLSTARVFSARNRTAPWEGRPLLKKSFTAFLNSELRKLYKTGLMTELRWPNIRKKVSNSGCFAISIVHFQQRRYVILRNEWGSQQTTNEETIRDVVLTARMFRCYNFLMRMASCCDRTDSTGCCFEVGELELSWTVLRLAGSSMPPGSATETFPLSTFNLVVCLVFPFWRSAFGGCARLIATQNILQFRKEAIKTGITKFIIELNNE